MAQTVISVPTITPVNNEDAQALRTPQWELEAWLALVLNDRIKPHQRRECFQWQQAQITAAVAANPEAERTIAKTLEWGAKPNQHLISISDERYPELLRNIPSPPLLLYVLGEASWLQKPSLAIVGSRHATALGLQTAQDFSEQLARQGLTIISGLAKGIDAAAHRGALIAFNDQSEAASTVAIIGTGIDLCYPSQNQRLYDLIKDNGCIVSEFPLGYGIRKQNFPQRNRIIAGLVDGVLVVEAARESGSLITANQANEYGREVFAIPNSIHSPMGKGCHQLIKSGAHLVEEVSDILNALPQYKNRVAPRSSEAIPGQSTSASHLTDDALEMVGFAPVRLDALMEQSGRTIDFWLEQLCDWELKGLIERLPDGRVVRTK